MYDIACKVQAHTGKQACYYPVHPVHRMRIVHGSYRMRDISRKGVKMFMLLRARPALNMLIAALAIMAALPLVPVHAATEPLFVTATGHYVRGVFRDYWDKNGGLPIFGYPITDEYIDTKSGKVVQYFERARFERTSPDASAVSLGLLGREATLGRTFATAQPIKNLSLIHI